MSGQDPPPPAEPPPPADPRAPTELPRLPSAGSRAGSARSGAYPPPVSAGLVRASSTGSLGAAGAAGEGGGLATSSSTGALLGRGGTPPGVGSRHSSRERLEPLATSPIAPRPESGSSSGRRSQPQLVPLGRPSSGSRGGSRPGTGDRERPAGVPALDLAGAPEGAAGGADGGVPPPPAPLRETDEERIKRRVPDSAAPPQGGTVKWVPHTHANPKHAKFCFICLHGRLEGQKDGGSVKDEVELRAEEEDLPPAEQLKELGYLLPGSVRFRRAGADFDRCNVTSEWLKGVTHRVYGESVKGMLAKQNEDIVHGRDVKLVGFHEDLKDRELLERLFQLSEAEMDGLDQKLGKLATWCGDQEARLLDVMPEPRPQGELPEVAGPAPEQLGALDYRPLVDMAMLKGESAEQARDAMREADDLITSGEKRGFTGFQVDSLPMPDTYADMPEIKIVPYEIQREDLPAYERQQPMPPTRRPIEANPDPFSLPFLFLPEFEETSMPEFAGTAVRGKPKSTPPLGAEEEWLLTTRSIFADNNVDEEEYGWGLVPQRGRIMPPLVDEPYVPPDDLVDEGTGKKRFVVRSVWDPEMFTQEGRMVPPIKDLARALYIPPPFTHPTEPQWSTRLAPKQDNTKKVNDTINIIPVYSIARFKPKRIGVTMPDFLWDLVKKDASGQGLWDVIKQRHEIPMEVRKLEEEKEKAEREEEERLRKGGDDAPEDPGSPSSPQSPQSPLSPAGTQAGWRDTAEEDMLQANLGASRTNGFRGADAQGAASGPAPDRTQAPGVAAGATAESFGGASNMHRTVREDRPGLPAVEVDVPEAPLPFGDAAPHDYGETRPYAEEGDQPASPSRSLQATQDHQQRVQELPHRIGQLGGQGRKIEEIISDDRFIDTLADKIALRMGGAGVGMGSPSPHNTMRGSTSGHWATGVLSGKETLDGQATTQIHMPEPPSFVEPVDESSKAELPRALQGNMQQGQQQQKKPDEPAWPTACDANTFTQEKMRGECYVRLLLKPEPHAARKIISQYRPETWAPDADLINKRSRPHVRMPPKPPVLDEYGEILEEEEFQDFEHSSEIVFSFVRHNRYEAVEALIQQDQDVIHTKDENENTLLHTACQNNNRRLTKLLLKNHIQINAQNSRGNTALHYCYQYGFSDLAEYLLAHGADDSILNQDGYVPAQGTGRSENLTTGQHATRTGGAS